jgi:hypothetical protein
MPRTVNTMASPGNTGSHGAITMYCRPSARIEPHEGVGGVMPSPRKLSVDSRMTRKPKSSSAMTGTICHTDGRM